MDDWVEGRNYRKKVLYDEEDLDSEGVRIQFVEVEAGKRVDPHYHKCQTEVYNVQNGRAILGIDDVEHEVEQGDTLICRPKQIHYVINDFSEKFRLLVVKTNFEKDDSYYNVD